MSELAELSHALT